MNGIKKRWVKFALLGVMVLGIFSHNSKVNADVSQDSDMIVVSTKKVSPYVIETVSESRLSAELPVGDQSLTNSVIDFSDAVFRDESGNVVSKDAVMESMVPEPSYKSASYSAGKWKSGSGYSSCTGMSVVAKTGIINNLKVSFKADFENIKGGYDRLNRIYSTAVSTGHGTWTWVSKGVFRKKETASYSAYGGAKGEWKYTLAGYSASDTKHVYVRVGKNTFWIDNNI